MKQSKLTELSNNKPENAEFLSRDAFTWMKKQIQLLKNPVQIARDIVNEKDRKRLNRGSTLGINSKFLIGGMYFFAYNPKMKNDLPYYDLFPLVIPLESYPDGFLGLNLHYLPYRYRFIFLNKLKPLAVYKDDEFKRLRVSYEILNASRRYREFKPCLKRYLTSHIRSRIITVEPNEWDTALYLPVHNFRKETAGTVWQESVEQINNT